MEGLINASSASGLLAPLSSLFPRGLGRDGFIAVTFWSYVAVALLIFTYLVPPFQKNDEPSHYYRAVSLANLDFLCTRDEAGKYYTTLERRYDNLPDVADAFTIYGSLDAKFSPRTLRTDFSASRWLEPLRVYDVCNLAPFGYVPNALGVLLGKPFDSPFVGFYLGRALGVACFMAGLLIALRLTPQPYRLCIYFYAGLPMVLHQVSSFSYDAVQMALFPLLFAFVTRALTRPGPVPRRELVAFLAALWLAVIIRSFAFYGLLLLYFVLPWRQVAPDWRRYTAITVAFFGITALTVGASELVYIRRSGLLDSSVGSADPAEQLRFVLAHPWAFIQACWRTASGQGEVLLRQAIGVFGWVGFEVSAFVIYFAVAVAAVFAYYFATRDRAVMRVSQAAALWLSLVVTVASLFFAMYAAWSPVGSPVITGLQGRYFLGLVPFAFLAVSQTAALAGRERLLRLAAVLVVVLVLVSTYTAVYGRYYGS